MRLALPGSALVHAGAVGLLFVGFVWPDAEDAAAPAPMTVSIISTSTVASNATEIVASDSNISSVSAGSTETIEPTTETLDPLPPDDAIAEAPPDTAQPVEAQPVERLDVAAIDPIELSSIAESALTVAPLAAAEPPPPADPVEPQAVATTPPSPSLEPESVEDAVTLPTPRSERPPDRPRPQQPPRQTPQRKDPPRAQQQGNSGNSSADSAAAAGGAPQRPSNTGSGGSAEVARYPSQVIGKLRRAMRSIGTRGEVVVRFTLLGGGQVSGISVARSSGNAQVDAAGLALVQRAAPYPPIPAGAGRDNWTFDVPLAFGG